mmetsp:Transcript_75436/g.233333  ORF Transcript_75436/g.233333 Transcript_75436/m.233333 type:complete len:439 (-) Transcript_75436:58-1374(-)
MPASLGGREEARGKYQPIGKAATDEEGGKHQDLDAAGAVAGDGPGPAPEGGACGRCPLLPLQLLLTFVGAFLLGRLSLDGVWRGPRIGQAPQVLEAPQALASQLEPVRKQLELVQGQLKRMESRPEPRVDVQVQEQLNQIQKDLKLLTAQAMARPDRAADAQPRPAQPLPPSSEFGPANRLEVDGARVKGSSPTKKLPPLLKNVTMRLVVNSHVHYWKPVNVLLESLRRINWTQWDDIVIFYGGSTLDIPPHKGLHNWTHDGRGITMVNLTLNNYDHNGMSGLYRYRDWPEVRAGAYLYIHDTSTVDRQFAGAFQAMRYLFRPMEVKRPKGFMSNVQAFTHDVVLAYKTNFDVNLTKKEGLGIEFGGLNVDIKGMHALVWFAKVLTWLPERQRRPDQDIYHTGYKRVVWWYPDFHIFKYIFAFRYGDIGGDGKIRPNR